MKDRVTRLPPVTMPFRDRADVDAWSPSVKYVLAEDIPQLERDDYKRMRPKSQSTMVKPLPPPASKPNRPPKPVNTFLMFCRLVVDEVPVVGVASITNCDECVCMCSPGNGGRRSWLTTRTRAQKTRPRSSATCGKNSRRSSAPGATALHLLSLDRKLLTWRQCCKQLHPDHGPGEPAATERVADEGEPPRDRSGSGGSRDAREPFVSGDARIDADASCLRFTVRVLGLASVNATHRAYGARHQRRRR
jgi:hypothetical protein